MNTEQYHSVAITKNTTALRRWLDSIAAAFFIASAWLLVSPISDTTLTFGAVTFTTLMTVSMYRWCADGQGKVRNLCERVSDFTTRNIGVLTTFALLVALVVSALLPAEGGWTPVPMALVGAFIGAEFLLFNSKPVTPEPTKFISPQDITPTTKEA